MRVHVVTDSNASVPDEYLVRLGIGEALATVNFDQESYLAKAELTLEAFYERLETGAKLPHHLAAHAKTVCRRVRRCRRC